MFNRRALKFRCNTDLHRVSFNQFMVCNRKLVENSIRIEIHDWHADITEPSHDQIGERINVCDAYEIEILFKVKSCINYTKSVESECAPVGEMRTPSHITMPLKLLWHTCRILLSICIQLQCYLKCSFDERNDVPVLRAPCSGIQLFQLKL